jgi:hypothetical protein
LFSAAICPIHWSPERDKMAAEIAGIQIYLTMIADKPDIDI